MVTLAVSLFTVSPAQAGHWEVSLQATGKDTVTVNGQTTSYSWPDVSGYTGGPAICDYEDPYDSQCDASTINATVTPTLTWMPDSAGDTSQPPTSVVVETYVDAGAESSDGSDTLTVNDGYNDPIAGDNDNFPDDGFYYWQGGFNEFHSWGSWGAHWQVKQNSNAASTVKLDPITMSASGGGEQWNASTGVSLSVTPYPVILTLGGTTKDSSGNDNILIGQGCVPNMSAGPCTLSNFQWNPGGDTFDKFEVASDFSTGNVVLLGGDALTKPSPLWHYSKDSSGDTFTVKCSATASINGTTIGTVQGQRDVQVWAPYYVFKNMAGPVSVANRFDGLELYAGGAPVGGSGSGNWDPPGMTNGGRVGTPDLFKPNGTGSWQFVQFATPGRWTYRNNFGSILENGDPDNGEYGLDNTYPYPGAPGGPAPPYPANSDASASVVTTYWMQDSPGQGLNDADYRIRTDDSFDDYMMYEPANSGYGSDWVPLHLFKWKWQGDISQTGTGWAAGWSPSPPGYVSNLSSTRCTTFPMWDYVLLNQ